tara:strand:+ start:37445 stop:38542 length:1098 start_codon:yes stop_codon:yes gene_type:complete
MAFLDNSGDIILDAVLTDTGRLRLAQGDGSFKISKFAFGDDEINYGLYDKNHSSGSAFYDLQILQTPVLEAFTNNTSNLKTKLLTISRTNILFMPTLKVNKNNTSSPVNQPASSEMYNRTGATSATDKTDTRFYVAVDQDTYKALSTFRVGGAVGDGDPVPTFTGVIRGFGGGNETEAQDFIRIDQGLDTNELAPEIGLDTDLLETAFIVELDYRLGRVKPVTVNSPAAVNFIDDDNIASYYLSNNTYINRSDMSTPANARTTDNKRTQSALEAIGDPQVFAGPRGNTLGLRIHASQELNSSTYLFTQIGRSEAASASTTLGLANQSVDGFLANKTAYFIDSTVRIVGANTGFRLDIPIRYVKIA